MEINIETTIGDLNTLAIEIAVHFVTKIDNLRAANRIIETPFTKMMGLVNDLINERLDKETPQLYRKFIELLVLDIAERAFKRKFENVSANA